MEEPEGVIDWRCDGERRYLWQQTQKEARMVVERSVSKDVGRALQSSGGSGSHSPLAGACFDVTQKLIFGERAVHVHTAAGGLWQATTSAVTLVPGSHRTEADVCPWALAFCLASKNTNSVNFFEKH